MYYLYKLAEFLMNTLPLNFSYWFASKIGSVKNFFSVKDKNIIMNNLKVVLGEKDERIALYTKDVFCNFCKYLVDFLRQDRLDEAALRKLVTIKGAENLKEAFSRNKGVILMSAHLGNWELGAVVTTMLGYPLNIIALQHKDKRVDDFFNGKRTAQGIKVIPLGGSIKKAFKRLDENEAIAILADRDFSKSDLRVEFFGKPAVMPRGIGVFKLRKDAAIVPTFIIRNPDNSYTMTYEKAVEVNERTGNEEEDLKNIVQKATEIVERYVKEFPDQWSMFDRVWQD